MMIFLFLYSLHLWPALIPQCLLVVLRSIIFFAYIMTVWCLCGEHDFWYRVKQKKWNFAIIFLALLDFVSRATVMAQASVVCRPSVCRPSSVRKLKFLRNRCMDPDKILWEATYPPYLQTVFFFLFFQNFQFSNVYEFFFVFVNMGPYGSKNFKTLLLLQFSSDLSQTLS